MTIGVVYAGNNKKLAKKMGTLLRWFSLDVPKLTRTEAQKGARFAREIAPYYSGALFQAIGTTKGRGGRGSIGWSVIVRTPKGNNPRGRPYHLMMHDLTNVHISKFIYSGDPHFMFTTASKMRRNYPELIKKELEKNLKK